MAIDERVEFLSKEAGPVDRADQRPSIFGPGESKVAKKEPLVAAARCCKLQSHGLSKGIHISEAKLTPGQPTPRRRFGPGFQKRV